MPSQAQPGPPFALLDYSHSVAHEQLLNEESSSRPQNFLSKLWQFLVAAPSSELIHWHRSGKYLIIPDEERLVEELIVKMVRARTCHALLDLTSGLQYKQGSYGSFARQLNVCFR
jgi:hypothetical protein